MKRSGAGVFVMVLQGAILLAGLFAAASTAPDDKTKKQTDQPGRLIHSLKGPDIYRAHCASCHGTEGKGDGPVAAALTTKMPDLTTITQR
ncbi:MAG: c-type cytochrome, partial [Candidatus Angelobacter sp.]